MPITKSELVKQLSKTYPNLLKKDLENFLIYLLMKLSLHLKMMKELSFVDGVFFLQKIREAKLQEIKNGKNNCQWKKYQFQNVKRFI